MQSHFLTRYLMGAFAAAALVLAPACESKKEAETPEMRELAQKAGELDKLSQTARTAGAGQSQKLKEAGVNDMKPNPDTLQLTEPQKAALEARLKAEKNSSYQALLQEVLDKDTEIKEMNGKMAALRAVLPKPDVARENDSHYGMAMRFLRKKGVGEEQARKLVSRVLVMDRLAPGFEVYHFYSNGVYGSWVSQGKSNVTPTELQAEAKAKLENERDDAKTQVSRVTEELADLNAQKAKILADMEGLQAEKTTMIADLQAMTATSLAQKSQLNSLHYLVGERKDLETRGIIVVPVFSKDRAGTNWADGIFTKGLDLREHATLTITAAEVGLKKIGRISVVPGSLLKDKHYTVAQPEDKSSATLTFLAKDRFRNEKVVFAVTD